MPEIIGANRAEQREFEGRIKVQQGFVRDLLKPVAVPYRQIDSRILNLSKRQHQLNTRRSRYYGRTYEEPAVVYVDRYKAVGYCDEFIRECHKIGSYSPDRNSLFGSRWTGENIVIVPVRNFEDRDLDAYYAAYIVRHELSHAGRVRKLRLIRTLNQKTLTGYRSGAGVNSPRNEEGLGVLVEEGHTTVEDEIFFNNATIHDDRFLRDFPTVDILFPGVRSKYLQLKAEIFTRYRIPYTRTFAGYLPSQSMVSSGESHAAAAKLMQWVYQDPELYRLGCDAVYGDRLVAFAKALNTKHGPGFFRKLWEVSTADDVTRLINGATSG